MEGGSSLHPSSQIFGLTYYYRTHSMRTLIIKVQSNKLLAIVIEAIPILGYMYDEYSNAACLAVRHNLRYHPLYVSPPLANSLVTQRHYYIT